MHRFFLDLFGREAQCTCTKMFLSPKLLCVFNFFSKDKVTGSGVDEGRGERFVPGTEEDLNENVKRETKRRSGKRILLRNKFVKKNNCRKDQGVPL